LVLYSSSEAALVIKPPATAGTLVVKARTSVNEDWADVQKEVAWLGSPGMDVAFL
jgi:hypothetical protein